MSSQRLPGKVLRLVHGRPLLEHVVEIVRRGGVDETVVATSEHESDDQLEEFCDQHAIQCVRGPLDDVASRFCAVLLSSDWDAFVRVSADSPLLDYRLVEWAAETIRRDGCDLATNIFPRSFPRGQSVEAVRRDVFLKTLQDMNQDGDQEHVTPALYRKASELGVANLHCPVDYGARHLAIDTPEDFVVVDQAMSHLGGEPWRFTLDQIVAAFDQANETSRRAEAA